jgi:hypothetical protein
MLRLLRHLRARVRYRHFDADLQEELRVHEAMKREELEASGTPPAEAGAAARRALGNVTQMREGARHVWIAPWLESVFQDARYGVRTLARQPVHSLTAIAVLVLAIGMNTSLFALLKATSFAPWPARDPDRVVRIWARAGAQFAGPSVDEYRFIREHATTLDGVAAYFLGGGSRLQAPGRVETYPRTQMVSANFLQVLGARLVLGAGFVAEDDLPALRRAPAIISEHDDVHEFLEWSRFGAAVAWGIGLLGLLLASVGVFGVFAYAVEERRREIGIRLALGAAGAQIVRTLVATSGRAMLGGLGVGVLLSLACGPMLGSYLFGLSPLDPFAYAFVLMLLVTAAGLATLVPALRACRVAPAITLRAE